MIDKRIATGVILFTALTSATPVIATQAGDILARARIINVSPDASSDQILLAGTNTPFVADSAIDVDSKVTLDIDFTYFVTDNFGVELLLDISSKHDIQGAGSVAGLGKVGEVTVLPPALIAQYHFSPGRNIRPYAGLGINYTFFFSEETTAALDGAVGAPTDLDVDDTFALVAQAGVDIDIDDELYFNIDLKYIDLDTTATINAGGAAAATVDFDLNPIVFGAGIGMRF